MARTKKLNGIWVYVAHRLGSLEQDSLRVLGKACQLRDATSLPVTAVLVGDSLETIGQELLDYGPDTVLLLEHETLSSFQSPRYAAALSELVTHHDPAAFLFDHSRDNETLASRLAVRCQTGLCAHCSDVIFDGHQLVQTVPGFGGNVLANIICPAGRPQMATITAGLFDIRRLRRPEAKLVRETFTVGDTVRCPRLIDIIPLEAKADNALIDAPRVVAGGLGIGSKENWSLVEQLADACNAAVGATRPPVDEGWASADRMIGASGLVIRPNIYIGVGISGMMHHTVGIQAAKTIIAINSDPNAQIFSLADYGIVGNCREILPQLITMLKTGESHDATLSNIDHTRSPQDYKKSIEAMRPNMFKFGSLIENPILDPRTKRTIEGHAQIFQTAHDPRFQQITTTISHLSGKRISRYLSLISSPEDMFINSRMKRLMFNLTGSCTGGRCAGWNAMNALWSTTWDMDHDLGTTYHERLKTWLLDAQERDITLSGALTDPKGNRKLSPSRQKDPDMYLRIVRKTPDSIVVRGAKIMICGTAAANELFVMPGTGLGKTDADYAVSFAIPKDWPGITIVETRHPSDERDLQDGFDNPVSMGGITQAYIFFEDVEVPIDRVFMCREFRYAGEAVFRFTLPYRSAIGGCVAGQGDVMVGAAILIARANGIPEKTFRDKLTTMIINNETTFGMGLAAAAMGEQHPSGAWLPDPVLANVNKVHVATLPYETKRLAQEIAGGIGETGCMPSYRDFMDNRYGHLIRKYLKAHSTAETRVRIARLIEWLTVGGGIPGCMHGGGSPDGARMVIYAQSARDDFIELAKRLGDISDAALG